jgi:hypothetical protein
MIAHTLSIDGLVDTSCEIILSEISQREVLLTTLISGIAFVSAVFFSVISMVKILSFATHVV